VKVRVSYVINADEGFRKAILHYGGETGRLATREEIRQWCMNFGDSCDDDLRTEHAVCCWGDAEDEDKWEVEA
jgi:hypothetical protein